VKIHTERVSNRESIFPPTLCLLCVDVDVDVDVDMDVHFLLLCFRSVADASVPGGGCIHSVPRQSQGMGTTWILSVVHDGRALCLDELCGGGQVTWLGFWPCFGTNR